MRTNSNRLRLPATLPRRVRLAANPQVFEDLPSSQEEEAPPSTIQPALQPVDDPADRYAAVWQDHIPSTGSRRPATQGKGSFRGSIADDSGREILFESTYEWAAAQNLLADRRVQHLQDQAQPAYYRNDAGEQHYTVFDFVATTVDDKHHALAIKPRRYRESSGIDRTVELVREQDSRLADTFAVRTEFDAPRSATYNAMLIRRSRKLRVEDDVGALAAIVDRLRGTLTIGDLLGEFRNDARGFTAVVNLIDGGHLIPDEPGRIGPALKVRPAA